MAPAVRKSSKTFWFEPLQVLDMFVWLLTPKVEKKRKITILNWIRQVSKIYVSLKVNFKEGFLGVMVVSHPLHSPLGPMAVDKKLAAHQW